MNITINFVANKVLSTLYKGGYEAFCVGGAIRDLFMGKSPEDYDIATNALPQQVMTLFPKTVATGVKHGTVTVWQDNIPFEITTYRTDLGYTDSRHPNEVKFVGSIEEDLSRRDFTINAIAYSPQKGIIDPWGGMADIEDRIIRCVGDPVLRFQEDALRIMRCFRFATTIGFDIESNTKNAALKLMDKINLVSRERIFIELIKMLCGNHTDHAAEFLGISNIGVLSQLPTEEHTRFAAYCLLGDKDPANTAKQLRSSNEFAKRSTAIYNAAKSDFEDMVNLRKLFIDFGKDALDSALDIKAIVLQEDTQTARRNLEKVKAEKLPMNFSQLALSGEDINALGFYGKSIGEVQRRLYQSVLQNPERNNKSTLTAEAERLKKEYHA